MVIDHGSRYYTTYANLLKSSVTKGQEVKKEFKLGSVGHDHIQFGVGLYFEIRHFSQPQNPDVWLRKPNKQLAKLEKRRSL